MSSKVISGDAARHALAVKWSRQGPCTAQPQAASFRPDEAGDATVQISGADFQAQVQQARQAGRREGEQAARADFAARVEVELGRIAKSVADLTASHRHMRREAEQDVVKLAIAIARKVLQREIGSDPEALLGLVKVALDKIEAHELNRVRVHPEHVRPLAAALEQTGAARQVEVFGDSGLERGAVIFETARGALDLSLETQLRQIERGFADLVARR